jgi:hypothetical protein
MSHWMEIAPPYCVAWRALTEAVSNGGLVHGMAALPHLEGNCSPADVASLVAAMVEHAVLRPVALDVAGAGHSVRAFRGIGPSAGGQPSPVWSAAEAHMWTYYAAHVTQIETDTRGQGVGYGESHVYHRWTCSCGAVGSWGHALWAAISIASVRQSAQSHVLWSRREVG